MSQSRLPVALRNDAVHQALARHPDPNHLLQLLESWASLLERDTPVSMSKLLTPETGLPSALKQTLIYAVKGN